MSNEVWLLIAGAGATLIGGLATLLVQRRWAASDRQRTADARALDAAIGKLTAWQTLAQQIVSGGDTANAEARAAEFDTKWEADFDLIPDQEAAKELTALIHNVYFFRGKYRRGDPQRALIDSDRLIVLLDRVIKSAREKRRTLA